MKLKIILWGLILLCFVPSIALAENRNSDQLLSGLTGKVTEIEQAYFIGYAEGIMDSHKILSEFFQDIQFICFPKRRISNTETRRVIIKYLERHPEQLNETARSVIFDALKSAFPCTK
jgi:hypothetical protein